MSIANSPDLHLIDKISNLGIEKQSECSVKLTSLQSRASNKFDCCSLKVNEKIEKQKEDEKIYKEKEGEKCKFCSCIKRNLQTKRNSSEGEKPISKERKIEIRDKRKLFKYNVVSMREKERGVSGLRYKNLNKLNNNKIIEGENCIKKKSKRYQKQQRNVFLSCDNFNKLTMEDNYSEKEGQTITRESLPLGRQKEKTTTNVVNNILFGDRQELNNLNVGREKTETLSSSFSFAPTTTTKMSTTNTATYFTESFYFKRPTWNTKKIGLSKEEEETREGEEDDILSEYGDFDDDIEQQQQQRKQLECNSVDLEDQNLCCHLVESAQNLKSNCNSLQNKPEVYNYGKSLSKSLISICGNKMQHFNDKIYHHQDEDMIEKPSESIELKSINQQQEQFATNCLDEKSKYMFKEKCQIDQDNCGQDFKLAHYRPLVSSSSADCKTLSLSFGTTTQLVSESGTKREPHSILSSEEEDDDDRLALNLINKRVQSTSGRHFRSMQKNPSIYRGSNNNFSTNSIAKTNRIENVLDNFKFLIERNLVATLISVYVLLSLAVIIVLMLPYLFNYYSSSENFHNNQKQKTNGIEQEEDFLYQEEHSLFKSSKVNNNNSRESGQQISLPTNYWYLKSNNKVENRTRISTLIQRHQQAVQPLDLSFKSHKTNKRENIDTFLLAWQEAYLGQCQPMTIPFCSVNLNSMLPIEEEEGEEGEVKKQQSDHQIYDKTLLPNKLISSDQEGVEQLMLEKFRQLIDIRCYDLMPMFLCSLYAPKCTNILRKKTNKFESENFWNKFSNIFKNNEQQQQQQQSSRLIPPCKSFCYEALKKCSFFFPILSIKTIDSDYCKALPESSDENVCVGQNEQRLLAEILEKNKNKSCKQVVVGAKDQVNNNNNGGGGGGEFKCRTDGTCIPFKWRCDGHPDCSDKSDEEKCSNCDMVEQFYCGQNVCIKKQQVCNGHIDCQDGRDERLCFRLSNNATKLGKSEQNFKGEKKLKRLEAWNASISSWMPICGHNWKTIPMSREVCQELGYSSSSETLILYENFQLFENNSNSELLNKRQRTDFLTDYNVLLTRELQTINQLNETDWLAIEQEQKFDIQERDSSSLKPSSLSALLNLGAQFNCTTTIDNLAGLEQQLKSTIYLQCNNFQCGQSVTSHLSRLKDNNNLSLATTTSQQMTNNLQKNNETTSRNQQVARSLQTIPIDDDDDDDDNYYYEDENEQEGNSRLINERRKSARFIIGGQESLPGEFPYMAALHGGPDEVFFCGATLISSNWLLTAAHCVENQLGPEGWLVKVGSIRRIASPAFVKRLRINKIIKHEQYNEGIHLNNDIALILLNESVEFNQHLRPACLPQANLKLTPNNSKDCVVVGFGKSFDSKEAKYLNVANFVNVPIIDNGICSNWYNKEELNLSKSMICAGYSEGKRDSCQGDSGSGLYCRHPNSNQFYIAGVVSWGKNCARPKLPGVYTSVPLYVDWIHQVAKENGFPIEY